LLYITKEEAQLKAEPPPP